MAQFIRFMMLAAMRIIIMLKIFYPYVFFRGGSCPLRTISRDEGNKPRTVGDTNDMGTPKGYITYQHNFMDKYFINFTLRIASNLNNKCERYFLEPTCTNKSHTINVSFEQINPGHNFFNFIYLLLKLLIIHTIHRSI